MANLYSEVGSQIRARRRALDLTLEDLELRCGLSASYIGQIERNVKKASLLSLGLLADSLGVRVSALFEPAVRLPEPPLAKRIEAILGSSTAKERVVIMSSLRHLAQDLRGLR